MVLPNVIIAGAAKCGTTSLFHWLSDHPEVCASKEKELCFFYDKDWPLWNKKVKYNYHLNGLEKYQNLFEHCKSVNAKVVIEATPNYLYSRTALNVIPTLNPRPKILFILRKPSDRVYSIYQFFKNN